MKKQTRKTNTKKAIWVREWLLSDGSRLATCNCSVRKAAIQYDAFRHMLVVEVKSSFFWGCCLFCFFLFSVYLFFQANENIKRSLKRRCYVEVLSVDNCGRVCVCVCVCVCGVCGVCGVWALCDVSCVVCLLLFIFNKTIRVTMTLIEIRHWWTAISKRDSRQ